MHGVDLPLVSIIIPVYNTESFIGRCVDSVLQQSYRNLEIILINDGSLDLSGKICDDYAELDDRVSAIHQENTGVAGARNSGLKNANGEFVVFVDSDDTIPNHAIESLLNCTIRNSAELVAGDWDVIGGSENFEVVKEGFYPLIELCMKMITNVNFRDLFSTVYGKVFNLSLIKKYNLKFDESYINGEDGLFFVNYISNCNGIYKIEDSVYTIFRYDVSERMSATSFVYYDFYRFYFVHAQKIWNIIKNDIPSSCCVQFYGVLINSIVAFLIRAAAYRSYFKNADMRCSLRTIVNSEMVKTAMKFYRRDEPSYSAIIPFFMRYRCVLLLQLAIMLRVKKYIKKHGLSNRVRSVYR